MSYKMDDSDPLPKLLRDMEGAGDADGGAWGFFVFCCMVAAVTFVALVASGCAVSVTMGPAKWNAPIAIESGGKQ